MKYPNLTEIPSYLSVVDSFYGYNHNLRIGENEFFDMKNLSSGYFPVLSPRGKRGTFKKDIQPGGLIAKDSLCYIDGGHFVMDQYDIDMELSEGEKRLVSMGAYVIILPDRKYINTADISDRGSIDASFQSEEPVSISLCTAEGGDIQAAIAAAEPAEPKNMDMWIDTSSSPHLLKQYSESAGMWVTVATTYAKLSSPGLGQKFQKYDGVEISGLKDVELKESQTGQTIVDEGISAIDGSFVVWEAGEDYLVITAMVDTAVSLSNPITVRREMPDMDYVIESGNRLWGCKYGLGPDGKAINEIYASKLGDFKNWSCYMGVSTDSYRASCGTDGRFTGAITHLGYPCFFKEGYLHKIYGSYPSNFQIQTTACRGVQRGSGKSLAIVGERLYYKGQNGICMYDGSLPVEVSAALGETQYRNAVAGSHGNKYYVSMEDMEGLAHLFVYDAQYGMWHHEDNARVRAWCSCQGEMYFIEGNSIRTVNGSGEPDEEAVEWMAETGDLYQMKTSSRSTIGTSSKKYISQVLLRLSMEAGAWLRVSIQYESEPSWERVADITGTRLRSLVVPIRPKRCDHFRLRLEGRGGCKLYTMTKNVTAGSDL